MLRTKVAVSSVRSERLRSFASAVGTCAIGLVSFLVPTSFKGYVASAHAQEEPDAPVCEQIQRQCEEQINKRPKKGKQSKQCRAFVNQCQVDEFIGLVAEVPAIEKEIDSIYELFVGNPSINEGDVSDVFPYVSDFTEKLIPSFDRASEPVSKKLEQGKPVGYVEIEKAINLGRRAVYLGHTVLEKLKEIAKSKNIDLTSVYPPEPPLEEIPKLVPLVRNDGAGGNHDTTTVGGSAESGASTDVNPIDLIPLVSLKLEKGPPTHERIARNIIAIRTALENSLVRLENEIKRLKGELPEGADSDSIFNHPDSLFSDLNKSYESATRNEMERFGSFHDDENTLKRYELYDLQIIFDNYNVARDTGLQLLESINRAKERVYRTREIASSEKKDDGNLRRHDNMRWAGADWVRTKQWAARIVFDKGNFPLTPSASRHADQNPGVPFLTEANSDLGQLSFEAMIRSSVLGLELDGLPDDIALFLLAKYDFIRSVANYPLVVPDPQREGFGSSRSVTSLSSDHVPSVGLGSRFQLASDMFLFAGGRVGVHFSGGHLKVTAPHGVDQEFQADQRDVSTSLGPALGLTAAFQIDDVVHLAAGWNNDERYRFWFDVNTQLGNLDARDIEFTIRLREGALPIEAPRSFDSAHDQATYSTGYTEFASVGLDTVIPIPFSTRFVDPKSLVPSLWLLGGVNVAHGQAPRYRGAAGLSAEVLEFLQLGLAYGDAGTWYVNVSAATGLFTVGSSQGMNPDKPERFRSNGWAVVRDGENYR